MKHSCHEQDALSCIPAIIAKGCDNYTSRGNSPSFTSNDPSLMTFLFQTNVSDVILINCSTIKRQRGQAMCLRRRTLLCERLMSTVC